MWINHLTAMLISSWHTCTKFCLFKCVENSSKYQITSVVVRFLPLKFIFLQCANVPLLSSTTCFIVEEINTGWEVK